MPGRLALQVATLPLKKDTPAETVPQPVWTVGRRIRQPVVLFAPSAIAVSAMGDGGQEADAKASKLEGGKSYK